ncbi:hypothetical protein MRX96_008168 [Rhipicephalus microplus]
MIASECDFGASANSMVRDQLNKSMADGLPDRTQLEANMAAGITTPVLLHQISLATWMDHTSLNQVPATDADRINTTRIFPIVQPATALVLPAGNEVTTELYATHRMSARLNRT